MANKKQSEMEKKATRAARNKKIKRVLLITSASVLSALLICVLVLSIVRPQTAVEIEQENSGSVFIFKSGNYNPADRGTAIEFLPGSDNYKSFVKAYNDGTGFSYMYGILDNRWFVGRELMLKENDDEEEEPYFTMETVNKLEGSATQPLAVVRYDKVNEIVINNHTITFDRMYFHFTNSEHQIVNFTIYLVDSEQAESTNPQVVEEYRVYAVSAWGNLSKMMDVYTEIIEG